MLVLGVWIPVGLLTMGGLAAAGIDEWTSIGPFGGSIEAVAIDPINSNTLYVGTVGGVYKSTTHGTLWVAARDGLPSTARGTGLVVDPVTPATVYAAIGIHGVYKSMDGGVRWSAVNEGLPSGGAGIMAIDPQAPATVYVTAGSGVYRSTDGGGHWIAASEGLAGYGVQALSIDPQTPGVLYAGTSCGVYKSVDGGAQWSLTGAGPGSVLALAIDPQTPATLYAGGFDDVVEETRVYKSTDGGDHWSASSIIPFPSSLVALAIDPQSPETLYAAVPLELSGRTVGTFRSVDSGETWDLVFIGPLTTALAVDPQVPTTLFAATLDGAWRSTDGGDNWSAVNEGLSIASVDTLAMDPQNPTTLYAGAVEGVFRSTDSGQSWDSVSEDLPLVIDFKALVVDPSNSTTVYAVFSALVTDLVFDVVFRSLDAGFQWSFIENGLPPESPREALLIDPQSPQTLFLAAGREGVFKTTNGGGVWVAANEGLGDASVQALAIDPQAPGTLYGGGRAGVYKSTDGGASWEDLSAGLPNPGPPFSPEVTALVIDPRNPTTVYALGPELGVVKSTDGGFGWDEINLGLRGEILALAVDSQIPTTLYAAGSEGVFRSLDGGNLWTDLNRGLAVNPVASLAVGSGASRTVYAGTRGGGVFENQPVSNQQVLALHGGRFLAEVEWRDFQGATGAGTVAVVAEEATEPVALRSSDSAVTQFFSPANWEMLIKVLDGRAFNDHHWVFLSAATDVEISTIVTDTSCGNRRTYLNPLGQAAPAVTDIRAFPECADPLPPSCVGQAGTLCLGENDRFQIETLWRDFDGGSGAGEEVSIAAAGLAKSDDSGLFTFFSEDNWELLVKVLDGCDVNDRYWVFAAATTDVEYTLTVTDTETDRVRTYTNTLGQAAEAVTDTGAFAACP